MILRMLKAFLHRSEPDIILAAGSYCLNPNKLLSKKRVQELLPFLVKLNDVEK